MNQLAIFTLKSLRKLYSKVFRRGQISLPPREKDPDKVSEMIYKLLSEDKPCMIARFGAFELSTVVNFLGVRESNNNIVKYIEGDALQWWWNKKLIESMNTNAGFFPPTKEQIAKFCELMINDIPNVDILGSWLENENYFEEELKHAAKVQLLALDPYWATDPWTKALEGKKVLVVHPFSETIKAQYKKRKHLFANNLLPEFELTTIKAVQSIAGEKTPFADWFEALDYMKEKINQMDYEICLIGAGAYGFPLAAHVKRMGKKSFHIGGSLQLLFGIRGKRWESPDYHHTYNYPRLVNKNWVSPNEQEKPAHANKVEGGCYW